MAKKGKDTRPSRGKQKDRTKAKRVDGIHPTI